MSAMIEHLRVGNFTGYYDEKSTFYSGNMNSMIHKLYTDFYILERIIKEMNQVVGYEEKDLKRDGGNGLADYVSFLH